MKADLTEAQKTQLAVIHFNGRPDGRSARALERRGLIKWTKDGWLVTEQGYQQLHRDSQ